jgi:hypothetical protein
LTARFWLLLTALGWLACLGSVAEILPAGTPLEIRLRQPLSSYSTPRGTKITGVLIAPVSDGGKILVPLGTTVEGSVISVRKVGLGVAHETAEIELKFDQLVLSTGQSIPIQCRITEVENARESINKKGQIQGIRSTSTISSKSSGVVGSLAFGDPIAAIFTTAGTASVLRFSEPEISLPAGTELKAELAAPIDLPLDTAETVPPIVTTPEDREQLGTLIRQLPYRTFTEGPKEVPSDLTNLAFIGSADALQHAFAAAGWVVVDSVTAATTYSTIRSVAENQGYKNAPMSMLLLDGQQPNYAYAKTLNTFSRRHHLRIWQVTQTWHGQLVWTSSATHDIGIGFSKKNKNFIHLIDTNIDTERAKVVNDMIYTGCVSRAQLVSRPWLPQDAKNGTNEALITDRRIAVLQLDDCEHPVDEVNGQGNPDLPVHGNGFERATRQTTLTLKNNIVRDNVVVMGYSGIRYGLDAKKRKEDEAEKSSRTMDIDGADYTIDPTFHPNDSYTSLSARPATSSLETPPKPDRWTPPTVELNFHGGYHGYYGGNGGAIGFLVTPIVADGSQIAVILGNTLQNGWTIGGSVTLDPQRYFSHEFSYDHSFTGFKLGLSVIGNDTTTGDVVNEFAFNTVGLHTSQVAYNLLINATPKTARIRPYLAIGPSLQLMHLSEAPIKKAPAWFKLGLGNVGLIGAAYNFGSTPPLEGGGIFQAGFNYGGGIRYRIAPRWMLRADFRETLISQPDFWTKSKNDILANIDVSEGWTLTFVGPYFDSAMRQDRTTGGLSFTF